MVMGLMRNAKKAQVSIFALLGIVLVVVIALTIYLSTQDFSLKTKKEVTQEISFSTEADKVDSYVRSCVKDLGEEGLIILGKQGGLINLRNDYLETGYANISYAYNQRHTFPSLNTLGDELSDYISQNLESFCTFENDTFYEITNQGRIMTKVYFTEDSTKIETIWTLVMRAENDTKELKNFKAELPVRVQKIHESVEKMLENPESMNLELIENKLENMNVKGFLKDRKNQVYVILDYDSKLKGESYKFVFAIKKQ